MMKKLFLAVAAMMLSSGMAVARKVTVSGYVTDAQSGETLIGAGVLCAVGAVGPSGASGIGESAAAQPVGAVTNNFGFYSIGVDSGPVRLTFSYIGYSGRTLTIEAVRDTVINVALVPGEALREAVVTARGEAGVNSTTTGTLEVPQTMLMNIPALFGEKDVLKALQYMPGIQGGTTGTSGIYVRGGGPDENLVLLDDIPLYNVSHMLGVFSVFTPEAVKKVTLFKGSFPARYGGRLSSVVDVRTNDGNMTEHCGLISVGMLSDRLHLEGPIKVGRTSYSLSGRVLHTFLFEPIFKWRDVPGNYWFYDLNGKLTHRLGNNDRLIISAYHGRDRFMYNEDDSDGWSSGSYGTYSEVADVNLAWGDTMAALRWNNVYGSRIFSNATVAYNHYEMDVDATYDESERDPSTGAEREGVEIVKYTVLPVLPSFSYTFKF